MCNCLYSAVNILMVIQLAIGRLAFRSKQETKKQNQVVLSINM